MPGTLLSTLKFAAVATLAALLSACVPFVRPPAPVPVPVPAPVPIVPPPLIAPLAPAP